MFVTGDFVSKVHFDPSPVKSLHESTIGEQDVHQLHVFKISTDYKLCVDEFYIKADQLEHCTI